MMAMAGDLLSSLSKRLGMEPSTMALGLDQIPESVFPALLAAQFVTLSMHAPSRGVACPHRYGGDAKKQC
jgi:hypothetical protein